MKLENYKGSTTVFIVLALIIGLFVGYLFFQNQQLQSQLTDVMTEIVEEKPEKEVKEVVKEEKEAEKEEVKELASPCDFSKDVTLKETTKYGIFGDDEFDTVVCGYLNISEENIFGDIYTVANLVITKFMDEDFKTSLTGGISEGNTVNKLINGNVAMGIGCIENGALVNHGNTTIQSSAATAIMASTAEKPVALIFSFEEHGGFGAACAGLMEEISLY